MILGKPVTGEKAVKPVFSPVTGSSFIIAVLLQELIVFILQDKSLMCVHGLFR